MPTRNAKAIEEGPLGIFLRSTVGRRIDEDGSQGILHVINIRDWHEAGDEYDLERRAFGSHCEARTWGAEYLEGLERYLDPTNVGTADYAEAGAARSTTCGRTLSSTSSRLPSIAAGG